MKSKRRFGLVGQINLVFTVVSLITSVLFVMVYRQTFSGVAKTQANRIFVTFSQSLAKEETSLNVINEYYSYVIYEVNENNQLTLVNSNLKDYVVIEDVDRFINNNQTIINSLDESDKIIEEGNLDYYFINIEKDGVDRLLITVKDNLFETRLKEPINNILMIGFLALIILGNVIILLWTSTVVERIKNLKAEISLLNNSTTKDSVGVEGNDEITDLSVEINKMRAEIVKNENTKQEMLQNLSHDIKTPIAVIKSYAEAIKDGVTEIDDIDVIIDQTNVLTSKVFKLLEWNRLEYIEEKQERYPVNLNNIIKNVANNFKFKSDLKFILDLDNSYIEGLDDYFYTMINNIVENAVRYAKTKIVITLKNKKITIFNDGDPIDDKFLNNDFRPYQKGHKGEFGLGLSIVGKTASHFNLKVYVKNINDGVCFTIEPF